MQFLLYHTAYRSSNAHLISSHYQLTNLSSLLEASHAQNTHQVAQQADSVRYLNELNGWLEAFVASSTSTNLDSNEIQNLVVSVERLYAELTGISSSTSTSQGGSGSGNGSLLQDVRQLVRGMKARDQSMATLQAAVNDLFVGLRGSGGSWDANALAHMIETQRRDQETMLRIFTDGEFPARSTGRVVDVSVLFILFWRSSPHF